MHARDCLTAQDLLSPFGRTLCRAKLHLTPEREAFAARPPQCSRDCERIDVALLPPLPFLSGGVDVVVVDGAERNGKFVADFKAEPSRLSMPQVMCVGGRAAADEFPRLSSTRPDRSQPAQKGEAWGRSSGDTRPLVKASGVNRLINKSPETIGDVTVCAGVRKISWLPKRSRAIPKLTPMKAAAFTPEMAIHVRAELLFDLVTG